MSAAVMISCACPDRECAERIAASLVDDGLAAAVHMREVATRYRWRGEVVAGDEVVLDIFTSANRFDGIATRIGELHPYELPPIHMVDLHPGTPGYLRWLTSAGAEPG
jgi:periplasmic divalent cation tolerance protein